MIKSLTATGFKSFEKKTKFSLSNINLITGINGRGKSSFLQIILLCKQSLEIQSANLKKIYLNGNFALLGSFDEVKNINLANSSTILFEFELDNESCYNLKLSESTSDNLVAELSENFPSELSFLKSVHYVSADRLGPQQFYIRAALNDFVTVGTRGELVGNVLFQKREDLVSEKLYLNKDKTQELLIQVAEWINYILDADNLKIDVKDVGNGIIILAFQFGNNDRKYKPSNVGFGYSYILPIILSGLIAKDGEILIIENPEAHLHPKAQSRLIEFLSIVSNCGVQIFIESHSEHILNALRVRVVKNKETFSATNVSILYFQDGTDSRIKQIDVESNGGINIWPDNFFDQTKKDLQIILNM